MWQVFYSNNERFDKTSVGYTVSKFSIISAIHLWQKMWQVSNPDHPQKYFIFAGGWGILSQESN